MRSKASTSIPRSASRPFEFAKSLLPLAAARSHGAVSNSAHQCFDVKFGDEVKSLHFYSSKFLSSTVRHGVSGLLPAFRNWGALWCFL